jgi:hypothetical protein
MTWRQAFIRLLWALYGLICVMVSIASFIGLVVIAFRGASVEIAYWVLVAFVLSSWSAHIIEHKQDERKR